MKLSSSSCCYYYYYYYFCYLLLSFLLISVIARSNEEFLYFWHLSDPHLDMDYKPGSIANCNDLPICCRVNSTRKTGDLQTDELIHAGRFGTPNSNCDIPLETFESAVQFVRHYFPKDFRDRNELFVLYGGDNLAHDDWDYSREKNLNAMNLIHKSLFSILRPVNNDSKSLVLSTIGNHDGYPVDQFDLPPGSNWFLNPWTDVMMHSGILEQSAFETMRKAGYYTVSVRQGLRVLVLNTQWQDNLNFFLWKSPDTDPAKQLSFIRQVLQNAMKNKEKVIIVGHIPPGIDDRSPTPSCKPSYTLEFQKIVDEFADLIIMQAYGHTHTDSFRIIMDAATNSIPRSVAFISPSVTTWVQQNPAVRLFKFKKEYPYDLIDIITFISNITQANIDGFMRFDVEYSMKDFYQMKDLTPMSFHSLANQLLSNDTVWIKFQACYNAMLVKNPKCNRKCRLAQYCSTVNMDIRNYASCTLN
jgi:sphingomyelin phosphodiesterase